MAAAAEGPRRPSSVVIIVNPDSGPGKVRRPNFARVIDQAKEKGFTVIGYVSTRYAKRPAEEVKEDVDRWVRLYPGVQGIFFDEQASAADRVDYYAALYEYARKQRGLRLVVSNPGTTCAEEYLARPCRRRRVPGRVREGVERVPPARVGRGLPRRPVSRRCCTRSMTPSA